MHAASLAAVIALTILGVVLMIVLRPERKPAR